MNPTRKNYDLIREMIEAAAASAVAPWVADWRCRWRRNQVLMPWKRLFLVDGLSIDIVTAAIGSALA